MPTGEIPPRLLVLISPPGTQGFFEIIATAFPPAGGPPDPAAITQAAARCGIP
jgi:hypothetical protein